MLWNSPVVREKSLAAKFDLRATYALDSDIPLTYETGVDFIKTLRAPSPVNRTEKRSMKKGQSTVIWIASYVEQCLSLST